MTGDTTTTGDNAAIAAAAAARREAEERQADLMRSVSFGAVLLITAGLAASVWYGRTLAEPVPVRNNSAASGGVPGPSAFPAPAAPGFWGGGRAAFAGAARRPVYTPPPLLPVPGSGVQTFSGHRGEGGAPADRYVTPLHRLVDEVNLSDVARYWHGGDPEGDTPPPTRVLTAVDALESLTTLMTHPRRYPPELRPYTQTVSLELRNYLKVTTLAIGTGERTGDLQRAAARHLDRCNQAITRLDTAARRLASGAPLPPQESAVLP